MTDTGVTRLRDVKRRRRRALALWALGVCAALALAAAAVAWRFHSLMRASLPQLDGDAPLAGLSADVTVARDALGVPSIRAASRTDAARALGFLHAQDRFFQMDLARRHAAGELAELLGPKALDADKAARIHGLRAVARESLARLPAARRALLDAYADGANAGLAALREKPFEYLLLGAAPRPWLPEDCILIIHAMALDLQGSTFVHERMLGVIRDCYDNSVMRYFAPRLSPDDDALDGSVAPLPPIPKPGSINLRAGVPFAPVAPRRAARVAPAPEWFSAGSNNMALGGALTASGAGMVENDMHLGLRVPNTWYRVSMTWDAPGAPGARVTVTGVTHPGAPLVVAGCNGRVAWGFTNAYADTSDLVVLTPDPGGQSYYQAGREILHTRARTELIHVRGEKDPVALEVETSIWGPLVGVTARGKKIALKWVFHDPDAANLDLVELETANDIEDAFRVAWRAGIPVQSMLVADTAGNIGWTLCGRIPERFGHDGRAPATWAFGDRGWRGLLPPEKTPFLKPGPGGRLSTANQRLFGGEKLALIGDGGARPAQRAARIRELLARAGGNAVPRDLLGIALDDGAPSLARWHALLRDTLAGDKSPAGLREAAGETWDAQNGRASTGSAAYAIARLFRAHVIARALNPVFEPCADVYPKFNYNLLRVEEPVWNLVRQKPAHLLSPDYATWDDLLAAAARDTRRDLKKAGFSNPAKARWGAFNVSRIRHPLSGGWGGLAGRLLGLDMPPAELPGDEGVPRTQRPGHGASERFVVSPGDEENGIFEMPCGQSGHPLSPYYRAGHEAWVRGEPAPFLPGKTEHTLVLRAAR